MYVCVCMCLYIYIHMVASSHVDKCVVRVVVSPSLDLGTWVRIISSGGHGLISVQAMCVTEIEVSWGPPPRPSQEDRGLALEKVFSLDQGISQLIFINIQ